jgi:hypothetical protein
MGTSRPPPREVRLSTTVAHHGTFPACPVLVGSAGGEVPFEIVVGARPGKATIGTGRSGHP